MKPFYLLDANVIAELIRTNPNQSVVEHVEKYESLCAISATAWNELLFGVQRTPYVRSCYAGRYKLSLG